MIAVEKLNCNVNAVWLTMDVNMTDEDKRRKAGKYLQQEREKTGVPQATVAEKVGIHVVQLSRIENGHSGARRNTIKEIVGVINKHSETGYQIDVDEMLLKFGYAPEQNEDDLTAEILDNLRISVQGGGKNLTKAQKKEILDAAVLVARGVLAKSEEEKKKESQ